MRILRCSRILRCTDSFLRATFRGRLSLPVHGFAVHLGGQVFWLLEVRPLRCLWRLSRRRHVASFLAEINGRPWIGPPVTVDVRVNHRALWFGILPPLIDDGVTVRVSLGARERA